MYSILFYSVLFYYILLYLILFYSIIFYILFYFILFNSILFYYILYSILFHIIYSIFYLYNKTRHPYICANSRPKCWTDWAEFCLDTYGCYRLKKIYRIIFSNFFSRATQYILAWEPSAAKITKMFLPPRRLPALE